MNEDDLRKLAWVGLGMTPNGLHRTAEAKAWTKLRLIPDLDGRLSDWLPPIPCADTEEARAEAEWLRLKIGGILAEMVRKAKEVQFSATHVGVIKADLDKALSRVMEKRYGRVERGRKRYQFVALTYEIYMHNYISYIEYLCAACLRGGYCEITFAGLLKLVS